MYCRYVFSTEGHLFPIRPDLSLERYTEAASDTDPEEQPESGANPLKEGRPESAPTGLQGSPSAENGTREAEMEGQPSAQKDDRASEAERTGMGFPSASDGCPSSGTVEAGSGIVEDGSGTGKDGGGPVEDGSGRFKDGSEAAEDGRRDLENRSTSVENRDEFVEDRSGLVETGLNVESAERGSENSSSGDASEEDGGPETLSDTAEGLTDGSDDAHKLLSERRVSQAPPQTKRLLEEETGIPAESGGAETEWLTANETGTAAESVGAETEWLIEETGIPAEMLSAETATVSAAELARSEPRAPANEPSLSNSAVADVSQEAPAEDATSVAHVSSPGSEATGTSSETGESPNDGSDAATCPSPVAGSPLQDVVEASAVQEANEEPARINDVSKNVTEAAEGDEATWDVWTDQDVQPLVVRGARLLVPFPCFPFPSLSYVNLRFYVILCCYLLFVLDCRTWMLEVPALKPYCQFSSLFALRL